MKLDSFKLKPAMEADWKVCTDANSKDGYSRAGLMYACRWANLMEESMAKGETIPQCQERTSHEAGADIGVTGFMQGWAAKCICHFWVHGDELMHAYNRHVIGDTKQADEVTAAGGVVNPAIITIGLPV